MKEWSLLVEIRGDFFARNYIMAMMVVSDGNMALYKLQGVAGG